MSLQMKLRELFLLDQQVRALRSRLDAGLTRRRAQQAKLERLQQQHRELAEQHKIDQAKASGLEHQARDADAHIAKLREQMNSVRSNKEYSALLIEVNTFKNDKSKMEDEALAQMARVEQMGAELKTLEAKAVEQEKLVAAADAEVAAAKAEIGQQLADLTARRDAADQELPLDARQQFGKLSDMHEGEALAPVVEESRRHMEYSCGGCYMSIPVERVNALTKDDDQIVCCTNCGRILYLEEELKASMGIK